MDSMPRTPATDVGNQIGLGSFPDSFLESFLENFLGVWPPLKELVVNKRYFLTILGPFRPARVLAPEGPLWQEPAA